MIKDSPRIIFFGTPEFAVASLEALHQDGFQVVAVVTAPDAPSGRGQRLQEPPVKVFAIGHGIPVLQPLKLRDPSFIAELRSYRADLQVVVAFRMLPEVVWMMPSLGTFNLHASLLPQYRGAAPINWAIMNGETETGVTTFFLQQEIDTGRIIFRERVAIGPQETAGELHDRLMVTGARLVVKTAWAISEGTVHGISQEEITPHDAMLQPAPKIFREDCQVRWDRPAKDVFNHIRGLSPYPGAFSSLISPQGHQTHIKIYRAVKCTPSGLSVPGALLTDGKHFLHAACQDGCLELIEIQQAGKKRMETKEFLLGFQLSNSWSFGSDNP